MQDMHNPPATAAPYPMLFMSIGWTVLIVLLSSCSANHPVQREARQAEDGILATSYSIVCVIHGDGNYRYHNADGGEHNADEEALAAATRVAQRNPRAEMFIFHQKPRRNFLLFFPLHDGEFYYYRNGQLISHEPYWRDRGQSHFDPEVELYHRFLTDSPREEVNMFLYYGHEIPERNGAGYDASYPERDFTVHDLAGGLEGFTRHSSRFDLLILSTCFGGTPYTVGALGPFARYLVASPDNLHLSYFDFRALERLDLNIQDGDMASFAKTFASGAFDRLAGDIRTTVSVAVYEVDRVQDYVRSVHGIYDQTLTTFNGDTHTPEATMERCDCSELPAYELPTIRKGVDVLYRSAQFGRSQHKRNHSGWECWKERGPQAVTSQTGNRLE